VRRLPSASRWFLQTLTRDGVPLDKSFCGVFVSGLCAVFVTSSSQEVSTCCWVSKDCFFPTLESRSKDQPRGSCGPPSARPRRVPCSCLRRSGSAGRLGSAGCSSTGSGGRKRWPEVGDGGNCFESRAPRKQRLKNKSGYFNYGSVLLYRRSVSHTFIRNLGINQSLEARSCHSHCLQAPASTPPGFRFRLGFAPRLRIRLTHPPGTDFIDKVLARKKGSERRIFVRVSSEGG